MDESINNHDNKISFFKIFNWIYFHPVKLWKLAKDDNNFSYLWIWYFINAIFLSLNIFFTPLLEAIPLFIIIHFLFWVIVLILWLNLIIGFKISGVEVRITFYQIFRLIIYSSIIIIIYEIIYIIKKIFFKNIEIIKDIFFIFNFIVIFWFLIIFILGVKNIYNISFKRAILSVLIIPLCIFLLVLSILILSEIF